MSCVVYLTVSCSKYPKLCEITWLILCELQGEYILVAVFDRCYVILHFIELYLNCSWSVFCFYVIFFFRVCLSHWVSVDTLILLCYPYAWLLLLSRPVLRSRDVVYTPGLPVWMVNPSFFPLGTLRHTVLVLVFDLFLGASLLKTPLHWVFHH